MFRLRLMLMVMLMTMCMLIVVCMNKCMCTLMHVRCCLMRCDYVMLICMFMCMLYAYVVGSDCVYLYDLWSRMR